MNSQTSHKLRMTYFINLKSFFVALLTISLLLSSKSFAVKIGGNGGIQQKKLSCPSNRLLTGIKALHSDSVEQIKLRCHKYDSNRKWVGNSHWSSYSGTTNPYPSRREKSLRCPTDKWVTKISGVTKQGVITSIKLTCSELNRVTVGRNKRVQATNSQDFLFGNQGTWRVHSCESRAYDSGAVESIFSKYGWKLDSVVPKCGHFKTKPATPTLLSPSFSHNQIKSIVASPQKAQFTARNRDGDYGEYCISELNKNQCIVRFSENHPNWHASPVEKTIPTSLQGKTLEWKMRNCKQSTPPNCSEWSSKTTFLVLPESTQINNLRRNQQLLSRNLLIKWKKSPLADSYRIMILDESERNIPSFYREPEMLDVPEKRQVIKMDRSRTSIRVNIDTRLSGTVKIRIAACKTVNGTGRQCHDSANLLPIKLPSKIKRKKGH